MEVRPFTPAQIKLLETFADQAVIAIENVRLFQELKESLEQQTATSEILGVIASSPTDIQPVLDVDRKNAARLCDAKDAHYSAFEGDEFRLVASHGSIPVPRREEADLSYAVRFRAGPSWSGKPIHIHDLAAEAGDDFQTALRSEAYGHSYYPCHTVTARGHPNRCNHDSPAGGASHSPKRRLSS